MLTHDEASGLCSTCEHEPGCIYSADANRMVQQCEEFDLPFAEPAHGPAAAGVHTSPDNGRDSKSVAGLCLNCGNREACIFQKPEGGVWRCEEYV
jgi:hypothetical protein